MSTGHRGTLGRPVPAEAAGTTLRLAHNAAASCERAESRLHTDITRRACHTQVAAVLVAAAAGGVVVPALICTAANLGDSAALGGWAIPTAADIAFALAVLAVIGHHLPSALRAFLLILAVGDDLLAIVIIAVFCNTPPGSTRPSPVCKQGSGPGLAEHFEHRFRPISAAVVVPLFASFAAGVTVGGFGGPVTSLVDPVALGIVPALVLGKTIDRRGPPMQAGRTPWSSAAVDRWRTSPASWRIVETDPARTELVHVSPDQRLQTLCSRVGVFRADRTGMTGKRRSHWLQASRGLRLPRRRGC